MIYQRKIIHPDFKNDLSFRLKNVGLPSPPVRAQRRESFLYRQQVSFTPDKEEEEQIVTPFAQILATLKDVRNNLSFFLSAGGETGRRSNLYKTAASMLGLCSARYMSN